MIETITKEQFLKAYQKAPAVVQTVFDAESTTKIIVDMKDKFQLHIDNAGILGREVGYLLLGLTNPGKFVDRLKSQNFSEQMVNEITEEINQKIFVPLREQMRNIPTSAPEPTKPAMPQLRPQVVAPAATPRPVNASVPSYAPPRPVQSPTAASALNTPIPTLPPQPPRLVVASGVEGPKPVSAQPVLKMEQQPSTLAQAIENALHTKQKVSQPPPVVARPHVSNIAPLPPKMTMPRPSVVSDRGGPRSFGMATSQKPIVDSSRMLEDHEEPHIDIRDKVQGVSTPESAPLKPYPLTLTPAPQNLPGAMPPVGIPELVVPKAETAPMPAWPEPITPPASVAASPITPTIPQSSSSDPYREPIE